MKKLGFNNENKKRIKFFVLIITLILLWYLGRFFHIDIEAIQNSLRRFPLFYSGLFYIVLYVVVSFFVWFSKDMFWLTGAILFGAYTSALLVWIAEIINAFILFYLAHYLGRSFIEHYAKGRYNNLDKRIGCFSFPWFFIFRVAPLIPYRFLDLSAGLTCVSFKSYLLAVILGSPIKIFWIQYILAGVGKSILNNPYALVEYFLNNRTLLAFSFIYLILVFIAAFKIKCKFKNI